MSEWKEITLGEIAEITSSKRIYYADYVESGVPFFRSKEIINKHNKQDIQTELFITEDRYNEIENKYGVPKGNDILLTSVGTLGIPYLVKNNEKFYFKDGNLTWFRNINSSLVNIDYLYIWLKSSIGKQKLDEIAIGSTQAALTIIGLKTVEILLPPLPEQKAIASVLSSLDDKIDLLHSQNKTLEAMAETLFRQWFIEEADDGWEVGKLADEFDFTMGVSPPGNTYNEDKIGFPMYQGNADFEFRFPKRRVYTTNPKRFAEKYETLVSVRAPVGAQNMALEKCCIGRGVAAFKYKSENSNYTYTYFKLKSLMEEIKQFNETGTVFGSISKGDFENLEITIPPPILVGKFQSEVKSIDDKVIINSFQITTLEKLRDTLLPKLMSGEVRINPEGMK
ncbi:MAG: restriction endonuclease subunit S [Bacteroidetes bacterium]|nr:restriction endonuclease subunit S [Bacteroidota bacterium]MBU1113606.1 restriction endonuclease subunit S [Bacteroidota bacterium]MBU1800322.1 restriction endonuclease subunit S [Bacteroidota bacterium]